MIPASWIPFSRANERATAFALLRTIGRAELAANYHEHWQLSLDLNQTSDSRLFHQSKIRQYAREIAVAFECNDWYRRLDSHFDSQFPRENKI